jgi:hypothetical protein
MTPEEVKRLRAQLAQAEASLKHEAEQERLDKELIDDDVTCDDEEGGHASLLARQREQDDEINVIKIQRKLNKSTKKCKFIDDEATEDDTEDERPPKKSLKKIEPTKRSTIKPTFIQAASLAVGSKIQLSKNEIGEITHLGVPCPVKSVLDEENSSSSYKINYDSVTPLNYSTIKKSTGYGCYLINPKGNEQPKLVSKSLHTSFKKLVGKKELNAREELALTNQNLIKHSDGRIEQVLPTSVFEEKNKKLLERSTSIKVKQEVVGEPPKKRKIQEVELPNLSVLNEQQLKKVHKNDPELRKNVNEVLTNHVTRLIDHMIQTPGQLLDIQHAMDSKWRYILSLTDELRTHELNMIFGNQLSNQLLMTIPYMSGSVQVDLLTKLNDDRIAIGEPVDDNGSGLLTPTNPITPNFDNIPGDYDFSNIQ